MHSLSYIVRLFALVFFLQFSQCTDETLIWFSAHPQLFAVSALEEYENKIKPLPKKSNLIMFHSPCCVYQVAVALLFFWDLYFIPLAKAVRMEDIFSLIHTVNLHKTRWKLGLRAIILLFIRRKNNPASGLWKDYL